MRHAAARPRPVNSVQHRPARIDSWGGGGCGASHRQPRPVASLCAISSSEALRPTNINGLSEDELIEPNHEVVARLRLPGRHAFARGDARFADRGKGAVPPRWPSGTDRNH